MDPHPVQRRKHRTLSPQQIRVLEGVSKGYQYGEIAAQMGISVNTVRTYAYVAFARMGVRNAAEASANYKTWQSQAAE
jgi:DNA-binding NarL/FixJ family response regulator